jgi:hypothetical protein
MWALIPLLSFGLLAPAPFAYAAVRLHERRMWIVTAVYALAWLARRGDVCPGWKPG